MKNRKTKAFVSVFLALIMLPIYSITLIGTDVARFYAAKDQAKMANEMGVKSILAGYDKDLFSRYGLMAVTKAETDIKALAEKIVKANAESPPLENDNLNDLKLDASLLTFEERSTLADPETLKKQILDYEKIRIPERAVRSIFSLYNLAKDTKQYNSVSDAKMEYSEELAKLNLPKAEYAKKLEAYSKGAIELNEAISQAAAIYKEVKKTFPSYTKVLEKAEEEMSEEDQALIKDHEEKLSDLRKRVLTLIGLLQDQIKENKGLAEDLVKLMERTSGLNSKRRALEDTISSLKDGAIKDQLKNELTDSSIKIKSENLEAMQGRLTKDLEDLEKYLAGFEIIVSEDQGSETEEKTFKKIGVLEGYLKKISDLKDLKVYKYFTETIKLQAVDPEKSKEAGQKRGDLKEFIKKNKKIFTSPDLGNINDHLNDEARKSILEEADIGFFEGLAKSLTEGLENLKGIKAKTRLSDEMLAAETGKSDLLEGILISEYIEEKFKDFIDISGEKIPEKEYILFGKDALKGDVNMAKAAMFSTRLGLNSLYAFTDPNTRREALMAASSIAGWTGLGIPLVMNGILILMATGESLIDLGQLLEGNKIPAFKNASSWQLSFRGISNLLAKEAKDIAIQSVDNIYEKIEDLATDAIEGGSATLDRFISQTTDGIAQTFSGQILGPLEAKILEAMTGPVEDVDKIIQETFSSIRSSLEAEDDPIIKEIKMTLLAFVEEKYKESLVATVKSLVQDGKIQIFEEMLEEVNRSIQKEAGKLIGAYSKSLKAQVEEVISEPRKDTKELLEKKLDDYLTRFGLNDKGSPKGVYSGINYGYKDYLKLFTILRIALDRDSVLKRIALIIDMNMKKDQAAFKIYKAYTRFELTSDFYFKWFMTGFIDKDKKKKLRVTYGQKF